MDTALQERTIENATHVDDGDRVPGALSLSRPLPPPTETGNRIGRPRAGRRVLAESAAEFLADLPYADDEPPLERRPAAERVATAAANRAGLAESDTGQIVDIVATGLLHRRRESVIAASAVILAVLGYLAIVATTSPPPADPMADTGPTVTTTSTSR